MSMVLDAAGLRSPRRERQAAPDIEAVVCVPTYRRPAMLAKTLVSLTAQRTSRPFRVVVVDNEATERQGLAIAETMFDARKLRGVALVQPQQGNCHAINAALAAAQATYPEAPYILMIDDDEVASAGWLEEMIATAERTGVDVVGGPVYPVFEADPSERIRNHPVFGTSYDRTGPVRQVYGSGNFLIRTASLQRVPDPTFDVVFNHLGGGDMDFFTRCRHLGLTFFWNNEAVIHETVPASRQSLGWILRRGLRLGAINYHVERRTAAGLAGAVAVHGRNAAHLPVGVFRALRLLAATRSPLAASHPLMIALGRLCASVGVEHHQYKAPR